MNIRVLDEGPKAAVDRIDVKGLKRNRPQDVIDYLKVKPGDSMDLDRLWAMQTRLWDCGRFSKHAISITRLREDSSKVILLINLEEVDHLPLLTEPLSPVEQAALRVRQWLLAVGDGKDDLLLEYQYDGSTAMIAVNGMYGIVGRVQINATTKPSMGDDNDIAAVLTTDLVGIYLPNANLEIVAPAHGRNTGANIAIQPETDPEKHGKWSVSLGWGMNSAAADNRARPLALSMRLPPAAFLDFAHQEGFSYELRNGILTIIGPAIKAHFDAGTGRPLEIESLKPKDFQIRLQADAGVVKKQSQDFQTTIAATNVYDPKKPIGSFIAFVAQVVCHAPVLHNSTTEQRTRLATVVSHILTSDAFKTLDDFIDSPTTEPSDNPFTLPAPARDMKTSTGIMAMMGEYALPFTDIVFARGTWPSTLARLTCFAMTGHSESLETELGQLSVSSDTGPLASLVAAELLSNTSPSLSKYFAQRGLRDLSTAAFVKDIQSVLKRNAAGSQFITTVLKNIQNLDQSDLDSLRSSLPPNTAKAVLAGIEE
jgi:hypothetical protein